MREAEHNIQVACVNYFRYRYPDSLIYAIGNGGKRNIVVASKMKAEGVTAGIPDLHIPESRHGYLTLYIEMKNGKSGRVSEHQRSAMDKLTSLGHLCKVCRSTEEFIHIVDEYMKDENNKAK